MTAPTHDVAAEEAVIASCLVDAGAVERCHGTGLTPADFWQSRARYAYAAIRDIVARAGSGVRKVEVVDALTGEPVVYWATDYAVNAVTVAYELAQRPAEGRDARVDVVTLSWLSQIVEDLPTSLGAEWYARIVVECAQRRRAIVAAEQVAAAARAGASDVAARAVAVFGEIGGVPAPAPAPVAAYANTGPSTTSIVSGALDLL